MIFRHWAWFELVGLFPAAIAAIGTLALLLALLLVCLGLAVGPAPPAAAPGTKKNTA